MAKSVRDAIASGYRAATGKNLGAGWGQRSGVTRSVAPIEQNRFQEPEDVTPRTPNLSKMIRATVGLRPRVDPSALVTKANALILDKLQAEYHYSVSALLNPKYANKQAAQKAFDNAAMQILQLGRELPKNGNLEKANISNEQIIVGLQKRYGPVQRSESTTPSLDLRPSPVRQLDAYGMPRQTQGITPRAAVRRSMGLS